MVFLWFSYGFPMGFPRSLPGPPGRLCLEAALGFARQLNAAVGIRRSPYR